MIFALSDRDSSSDSHQLSMQVSDQATTGALNMQLCTLFVARQKHMLDMITSSSAVLNKKLS